MSYQCLNFMNKFRKKMVIGRFLYQVTFGKSASIIINQHCSVLQISTKILIGFLQMRFFFHKCKQQLKYFFFLLEISKPQSSH